VSHTERHGIDCLHCFPQTCTVTGKRRINLLHCCPVTCCVTDVFSLVALCSVYESVRCWYEVQRVSPKRPDELRAPPPPPPAVLFGACCGLFGRDSVVGSQYSDFLRAERSGDRITGGGGGIFSAPVQTGPSAHPAPCRIVYQVSFPGVKWLGRGVNHQSLSSSEVKERLEIYLYSFTFTAVFFPGTKAAGV
jgi:hypothetical protein